MKPPPFGYASAGSLAEAVALLAEHGDEAKLIAGGQSLMPLLAFRLARPSVVIDLTRATELRYIHHAGGKLRLGAITTHREVEQTGDAVVPQTIREAVRHIGHAAIRNRGTVGGSLAHADPSGEWAALALAYDAVIVAVSTRGERQIRAEDFFLGFLTSALRTDEVVREVVMLVPPDRSLTGFAEFSRRHGDFAIGGVCSVITPAEDGAVMHARISVIGAGPVPARCLTAEGALQGRALTDGAIADAVAAIPNDIEARGADEDERRYRRQVAQTLARRLLQRAAHQLAGVMVADG